ncbi:MAG: aldehyde dehydrogenase family protein [Thermodesulfobacteriota bacterium]
MTQEYRYLVDGEWKSSAERVEVTNPYNGEVVGITYGADDGDIAGAVRTSLKTFETTRALPAYGRAEILDRVVNGITERTEEIALTITAESGKPIADARGEVKRAVSTFQLALEEAKRLGGEVIPLDIMAGSEKRTGIVRRFPIGPILAITPFNFPLNLVAHKVAPAMAAGNTILLKPSPRTPLTSLILGEIITEAGWPAGGLNVFLCSNRQTEALVRDERIAMVTFTGSASVGWRLKEMAGRKRVALELGGNAGVIVHDDADIDFAMKRCVAGAFSFSGQVCISVQRIYVQREVYSDFVERFLEAVGRIQIGDPMDESTGMGPLIDEAAAVKTEEWVNEAVEGGAKLLTGGKRMGSFFEPTVLTGAKPGMRVSCEEAFAPLVTVEPYDAFEDAVELINDSPYGLHAGLFTSDIKRIFYAYDRLDVGGVVANDVPTYRVDNMPYGGIKMSGFGREGVRYAMEEMTDPKLLVLNLL